MGSLCDLEIRTWDRVFIYLMSEERRCVYVWVNMYVCIYVCVYAFVCVCVCVCVRVRVCVCARASPLADGLATAPSRPVLEIINISSTNVDLTQAILE